MSTVDLTGKNDLDSTSLALLQKEFKSERITDDEMCNSIRQIFADYEYLMDPHTAVAFAAAQKLGYCESQGAGATPKNNNQSESAKLAVLLSTASPCKFEESVTVALGPQSWKQYFETEFPARGKAVLEKDEIEPVLYKAQEGIPLEKTQIEWEAQARILIDQFHRL